MLSCQEIIDEIQVRVGRPNDTALADTTWLTRRINEAQKLIVETVPLIPSQTFKNITSLDTTGAYRYALSDVTVGDSSTGNSICHLTDVWYLDGNESRRLVFVPHDEFDLKHPDLTHSDENFEKPREWTRRDNQYIEMYPYCASAYWDKDLRFDGDFYAADFTTDSTEVSDITGIDEGLILYGTWRAWAAIASAKPANAVNELRARKEWSNPEYDRLGESPGWLETFTEQSQAMIAWSGNLYDD